jgi:hypothetical protein
MKRPKPELYNNRVLLLARRTLTLPFALLAAVYHWVSGRIQGRKSDTTRRAEDQLRQSRSRRVLRGLPPDHVQDSPKPS